MRAARLFLTLLLVTGLTACGFQLKGSYELPFKTLALGIAPTSELYARIKRTVEASSPTRVVANPAEAEAILVVLADVPQKVILSLDAAGRAREYQLVRSVSFKLIGQAHAEYIAPSQIVIRRDITYHDDLVLSKESEEALLWRDMQADLVQQLMRRLAAARLQATED